MYTEMLCYTLLNYVFNRPKNLDLHVEIAPFTWCLCNLCHLFFPTCVLQVKILKQIIYLGVSDVNMINDQIEKKTLFKYTLYLRI